MTNNNNISVVIDNGTGYTKMGFAGNQEPLFVIPTVAARKDKGDVTNVLIGEKAIGSSKYLQLEYPIRNGQIKDWSLMESFWLESFYSYLQVHPENHNVLLTEPPYNTPENREFTAEIMFETLKVPGLHIAVQAVLALASSWGLGATDSPLTGTVIDSGDGVTHIIPVVDGYAISGAIQNVPLAGREVTHYLQKLLREGKQNVPPEDSFEIASSVKEKVGFVALDFEKQKIADFDFEWNDPRVSSRKVTLKCGREVFWAPELFFQPQLNKYDFKPLPLLVDQVVQSCAIDCRRGLYKNIVLSGGSTMFRGFGERLEKDLKVLIGERLAYTHKLDPINKAGQVDVKVVKPDQQRYAVWNGGSLFASMEQFGSVCVSRQDYEEHGPSVCRKSRVFTNLF